MVTSSLSSLASKKFIFIRLLCLATFVIGPLVALGSTENVASAVGILPPNHPALNIPASPPILGSAFTCKGVKGSCTDPCIDKTSSPTIDTPGCIIPSLSATNKARADEGVGHMLLPSNWYSLTIPEQLFVVANEERIGRGEDPLVGLNATLDATAQAGAATDTDPLDNSIPYDSFTSNWAGGYDTVLAANFGWMYQDGWGGSKTTTSNIDCKSQTTGNCWGHRFDILFTGTCTNCVMGAGYSGSRGFASFSQLFIRPSSPAPVVFSWNKDVVPNLKAPITTAGTSTPARRTTPTLPFGYWMLGGDGGIYSFGDARFHGSTGGMHLAEPIVNFAPSFDDRGYWLVAKDGGVFAFGKATFYGALPGTAKADNVIALVPNGVGHGYWIVRSNGDVYPFHAPTLGNATITTGGKIVGAGAMPGTSGYWLVTTKGKIYAFGTALNKGTLFGKALNQPIVGVSPTSNGDGYWMVAKDGGIFGFGNARFFGSMGGKHLNKPIVGIATMPNGKGYWLVASDGGIFNFGKARFYGSLGVDRLNSPIIAMIGTSKH